MDILNITKIYIHLHYSYRVAINNPGHFFIIIPKLKVLEITENNNNKLIFSYDSFPIGVSIIDITFYKNLAISIITTRKSGNL